MLFNYRIILLVVFFVFVAYYLFVVLFYRSHVIRTITDILTNESEEMDLNLDLPKVVWNPEEIDMGLSKVVQGKES